jgi:hypothetical protein
METDSSFFLQNLNTDIVMELKRNSPRQQEQG